MFFVYWVVRFLSEIIFTGRIKALNLTQEGHSKKIYPLSQREFPSTLAQSREGWAGEMSPVATNGHF